MEKMLKCMPHAQAFVEDKEDGSHVLTSYATKAATLTADGWLTVHCWCSRTTRNHIAAFVDEYVFGCQSRKEQLKANTGSYQIAKAAYESGRTVHPKNLWVLDENTGEVTDL